MILFFQFLINFNKLKEIKGNILESVFLILLKFQNNRKIIRYYETIICLH